MRTTLLQLSSIFLFLVAFNLTASARVWRVNNNSGVSADFASVNAANNSGSVVAGDILYVEGSATSYGNVSITKAITLIGPGYFLSGAGANTGLQYNGNTANFTDLQIATSGVTIIGIEANVHIFSNASNITITRSKVYIEPTTAGGTGTNWVLNKCYLGMSYGFPLDNLQVTNCIVFNVFDVPNSNNGLIRNNTFITNARTSNSYVSNNIFVGNLSLSFNNCSVRYNLSTTSNLSTTDNNQINVSPAALFVNAGSTDGQYQLAAGSPALNAGEEIGGVTPHVGAFGTADPYRLSGIPSIPTIYSLTVPATIPSSATTINVSFSSRSNN